VNNELVINVTSSEIVIALLDDKQLVELNKDKSNNQFAVGDIYLAKVKKIMSGLNAAFVDVGYERDAFLHYLDLGPQFQSLNRYVQQAMADRSKSHPLESFNLSPDIDKNGKITSVLTGGQQILVQIAKEPISTKGPRLSSELSIAGRNMVLIPFSDKVSVSQKIKSAEERNRLKKLVESIKPKNYGVIIRTVAKTKRVATLDAELRELVEKWEGAFAKLRNPVAPCRIIGELNRTSAILRDILNASFNSIHVNDEAVYNEIREYISTIAPEKEKIVKLYTGNLPIFDHFGIDKQIKGLFGKTVTIKSGAYLIIEHTEALHVIDVNSGNRSKKENDQETNALEVNMIAADEIARQLRLRDMGGIIVVDFIDMHEPENRKKVFEKMKLAMAEDRTKHNILPLSKFGLMQITRQRVRPEMSISTTETCPACGGSGEISPSILIIDQIENNIRYIISTIRKTSLTVKLHPYVAAFITNGLFSLKVKWWLKFKCLIKIEPVNSYQITEFHIFDNKGEEIMI
jgi:ribonuclease G